MLSFTEFLAEKTIKAGAAETWELYIVDAFNQILARSYSTRIWNA